MWALDNETPYAAERNWCRDKRGVHLWLVAVRATFEVSPTGALSLLDEQPPPLLEPQHRGVPGQSSLRVDSDLLNVKLTTDIILDAYAHAPRGQAASSVPVSFRVADFEKSLVVHGPRTYGVSGRLSTSAPFQIQPIVYESAFGGVDAAADDPQQHRIDVRNPVGRGFAVSASHLTGKQAHTIEHPTGNPANTGPAGYGPIDRSWSPRLELAGTYDARWLEEKRPLLPDDFDDRFAQCAPRDQQLPSPLRGGESVQLLNMTPSGTLRFDLPKLYFAFTTRFGSREEEHRGHLVTVFIEPEVSRLSMVWQTALPVQARLVEQLDETVIAEKRYL
jgi:hypothetical protein